MDGKTAFTKKDIKELTGSTELRRQVKIPKAMLSYCTPLALETNGKLLKKNTVVKWKLGNAC